MTQTEIENAFWNAAMRVLGYDPTNADQNVQKKVRISWPLDDAGSPNWSRTEDTVFLRALQLSDAYSELWDIGYNDSDGYKENVSNHEAYEVQFIVYGLNALEVAQKLRYGLLREDIRQPLIAAGIGLKPEIRMPSHVPEQDRSGDWWNRYDFGVQMYIKQTRDYEADYITQLPTISVTHVEYPDWILDESRLDVDRLGKVVTQTA